MSSTLQGLSHSLEVVDLAVKNDCSCLVLVENRLPTSPHINNTQASMSETDGTIDIEAIVVWATMVQHRSHTSQLLWVNSLSHLRIQNASYAAHVCTLYLWSSGYTSQGGQ